MKKLLTILILLISGHSFAQINLPSFFSDNMILQRNAEVSFWGWGNKGAEVTVTPSWSNEMIKVPTTGHARFDVKLKTPEAGGPYEITVTTGIYKKVIKNILIGEVWLCSGQSNMQWNSYNRLKEMLDELPNATNPKIRLLNVSNIASLTSQDNTFDSWQESNPETVAGFSAIGYFIAKHMSEELNVPVGIINSSWGGTAAEFWTPARVIDADEELAANAKKQRPAPSKPYEAGSLWNSMINPFVGYNISGVFWYQGESNIVSYSGYNKLFSAMINSWRTAWKSDFPFYYVQIAPYDYKSKPEEQRGALLREQQVQTLSLPKTGMAVVTDLVPDVANIHPTRKVEVAKRLADLALVEVYGKKKIDYKSPVYKRHKIEGDKIIIEFNDLKGRLKVDGAFITDLLIADDSKKFIPADYKIVNNQLIVFSKSIKKPVAVRFGFSDVSRPNLFNSNGLPVSPFRTDNWNL
ncbi:sialate O-acetylesterase [Pedobacter arcticus]|uniref:sialate O-acetylesterase n=1 Tax=Pedobacter arcticus TaxID=752140 RepID=UPI000315CDDF|nr:sialate O-acetylesterase [Pedobacter arcticus]